MHISPVLLLANGELVVNIIILCLVLVIPFFSIILSLIYLNRMARIKEDCLAQAEDWEADLREVRPNSMDNLEAVSKVIDQEEDEILSQVWKDVLEDSQTFFKGRWLPPLESYLNPQAVEGPQLINLLSFRPPILFFSISILTATALWIYLRAMPTQFIPALALIPLAIGLASSLFLANSIQELRIVVDEKYQRIYRALSKALPIYNSQQGVALLVDEMLSHESELNDSIQRLEETTSKMATADFAQGISLSVRQIMSQEIAPPLRQASENLGDLARNLDQRQMTGMEKLAGDFSGQLSENLARHLGPLRQELMGLNQLMARTRDFIQESVTVLNSNREYNAKLNQEISQSLRLMTAAKNDLANEMSEVSQNAAIMSETSTKMSQSFAGKQEELASRIKDLDTAMRDALQVFSHGLKTSSASLELAGQLKQDQEQQFDEFSRQLSSLIVKLEEIDQGIKSSSASFTQESAKYVEETLQNFDQSLAEVVERLLFTASALRDAVDNLPASLKQIKN